MIEGAEYHHERYDGRGYPKGLKGQEIPLFARIIGVADAFDAMTANRVYRKQLDFDYVLGELEKGRGTQFDPQFVDILLELIRNGKIDMNKIYHVPKQEAAPAEAKTDGEKTEKTEKTENTAKTEKTEKTDNPEKTEKTQTAEKTETAETDPNTAKTSPGGQGESKKQEEGGRK